MTNEQFDILLNTSDEVYDAYMEYIMENCDGSRVICNGDTLLLAAEDGYLYEEFRDSYIKLGCLFLRDSCCLFSDNVL